jgi:hypothetical protein
MELCFFTMVPEIVMTDFHELITADDVMQIEDISKDISSKVILFSSTSSYTYPKNRNLLMDFMELDKPIS